MRYASKRKYLPFYFQFKSNFKVQSKQLLHKIPKTDNTCNAACLISPNVLLIILSIKMDTFKIEIVVSEYMCTKLLVYWYDKREKIKDTVVYLEINWRNVVIKCWVKGQQLRESRENYHTIKHNFNDGNKLRYYMCTLYK